MAKVRVEAGICGFTTEIIAEMTEANEVAIRFESTCRTSPARSTWVS
jgi:hypothetical protein